jgi:hypothetical protein
LPFPIVPEYCFAVLRSGASRLASVALLVMAGSIEPVWEIGHALVHAEIAHHASELPAGGTNAAAPAGPAVFALPSGDGHSHPLFQAPARPSTDLVLTSALLPSAVLRLPLESLAVQSPTFPGISARASPAAPGIIQPRAPPVV